MKSIITALFSILICIQFLFSCKKVHQYDTLNKTLSVKIDSMRTAFNFPAVAYGVIRNDSVIVKNALGYRDIKEKTKVTASDYFHIGSCTKSFTALLAGKLVEEGLIDWDTKFFDLYPELRKKSHAAYYTMNLKQLLSHRSGLIGFNKDSEVFSIISKMEKTIPKGISIEKRRYYYVSHFITLTPLDSTQSRNKLYSNAGFIAANLMLEKVSGKSWEQLIQELSEELELDIIIGWPTDYNEAQPRGHINPQKWLLADSTDLVPIPEISKNYPPVKEFWLLTSPSGHLSITVDSFLKYASLYLQGIRGKDNYLKSNTYKTILHSYSDYTLGWWVEGNNENTSYAHRGSNGTFYAFIGIDPKSNSGTVVMINTYEEPGLTDIIQYLKKETTI